MLRGNGVKGRLGNDFGFLKLINRTKRKKNTCLDSTEIKKLFKIICLYALAMKQKH